MICGTDGQTDGRTDGRTDGVKPIYPPTTSFCGRYNKSPGYPGWLNEFGDVFCNSPLRSRVLYDAQILHKGHRNWSNLSKNKSLAWVSLPIFMSEKNFLDYRHDMGAVFKNLCETHVRCHGVSTVAYGNDGWLEDMGQRRSMGSPIYLVNYSLNYNYEENWCLTSLWPGDAIWRHRSGSSLAQVMDWCLMVPSHYLKQCWHK